MSLAQARCTGLGAFRAASPRPQSCQFPPGPARRCVRARASTKDVKPDLWAEVARTAQGPDLFPELHVGQRLPEGYGNPPPAPPKHRRSGVILHPTSLTGPYGIGEIGTQALRFIDWLHGAGQQLWQILPLCPPETEYWSPYSGVDALCGNPLLIPLAELVKLGLLEAEDLPPRVEDEDLVDYPAVFATKMPLLEKAARAFLSRAEDLPDEHAGLAAFRAANPWVEQSALFAVLTDLPELRKQMWWEWPAELRDRDPAALDRVRAAERESIDVFIAIQYFFDRFWGTVRSYANERGIRIMGDMPIYVSGHSADVWANRHLFALGADGAPLEVSGVPPDAFSATGQLWGSPLYDWEAHRREGYAWWVQRFQRGLQLHDEIRVDHFRAFAGYWAVDAAETTALNGVWRKGPGAELFDALRAALGDVPILAEDLGVITPDVHALRLAIGAPGMVVLQFAWGGGPTNTHLPHNIYENAVVYPGTHDNQTVIGWWRDGCQPDEADLICHYIGHDASFDPSWALMRAGFESCARTVVTLMQDVMRCDDSARMNTPGKAAGNWGWRLGANFYTKFWQHCDELCEMTRMTDRLSPDWVDPRIDAKAEMERHLKEKAAKAAKAAPKKQKTAAE